MLCWVAFYYRLRRLSLLSIFLKMKMLVNFFKKVKQNTWILLKIFVVRKWWQAKQVFEVQFPCQRHRHQTIGLKGDGAKRRVVIKEDNEMESVKWEHFTRAIFDILTFAESDSDLHPLLKLLRLLWKRIFKSFVTLNIATIEIGPFFSLF